MTTKPNILFVFSDQHRHDVLGCAGHPLVETPHLDRLAAEGARFTRAWCQSPICQPSRASVITGAYTEDLGIFGNTRDFNPAWPTIMKTLQDAGYVTASIGKTHYHGMPSREEVEDHGGPLDLAAHYDDYVGRFGWDYVLEEYDRYVHASRRVATPYTRYLEEHGVLDGYREQIKGVYRLTPTHWRGETGRLPQEHDLTSFLTARAKDWLRERAGDTSPFLLEVGFVQPHVPLIDDPTWAAHYADAEIPLPDQTMAEAPNEIWGRYLETLNRHSQIQTMDEEFIRAGIRHYLGMVSLIDQKTGELMETLASTGDLDNTWIFYSCDHGEMLGEHHLWAKMNFYKGAVQVPLILRPPSGTGDHDAAGLVLEDLVELTDVSATFADIAGVSPQAGCRGNSLLPAFEGRHVGHDVLRSRIHGFSAVRDDRYRLTVDVETGTPCELFDLSEDPGERHNQVNDPAIASVIEELTADAAPP